MRSRFADPNKSIARSEPPREEGKRRLSYRKSDAKNNLFSYGAMGDNGGSSYQQRQHDAGTYQEIPNGSIQRGNGKRTKVLAGVALLAVLGSVGYGVTAMLKKSPVKAVKDASTEISNANVKSNGKLKLFDALSTSG